MGLQLLVHSGTKAMIEAALFSIAEFTEVFHVTGDLWGVSIPTKVVDDCGEDGENSIYQSLSHFTFYTLYDGQWRIGQTSAT